jgi:hypothetical protein
MTWWNCGWGEIISDVVSEWYQRFCYGILFEGHCDNYRMQLLCESRTVLLC